MERRGADGGAELTFEVLRALALLAGLADDLDGAAGEGADDALRLVVGRGGHDLDEGLDLFLLLVDVRDEELLADAAADERRPGRRVAHVERLARRGRPLDRALLWRRLARNGNDDAGRAELGLLAAARDVRPPRVPNHDRSGRRAEEAETGRHSACQNAALPVATERRRARARATEREREDVPLFCPVGLLGDLARHDDHRPLAEREPVRCADILVQVLAAFGNAHPGS